MKLTVLFSALVVAAPIFAAPPEIRERALAAERHVVLHSEHVLLPEERERLAARGVVIVSEAGANRYVARIRRGSRPTADYAVASVEEIKPESKLGPSALRALSAAAPLVRAQVVFHRDVDDDTARRLLESAGAAVHDPTFAYPSTMRVTVARGDLLRLAELDAVAQVHAVRRKVTSHNAAAAQLSKVDIVQAAPYNLTGSGVKVSVSEVGNVFASHVEFGGRVTALNSGAGDAHATHVVGTVAASGVRADARGMAPNSTVVLSVIDDGFLESKESLYPNHQIFLDNNSWGYILGWQYSSAQTYSWQWWGNEEFGAYALESAGLDRLSRRFGTLIVYSAGNDGNDAGPNTSLNPNREHYHQDGATVYCVSASGSGTDCPATPCGQCEKATHPADGPFGNMSILGASKNIVTVGAVNSSAEIASFSSRGPTADGRIKPDVVAKGQRLLSTLPNNTYGNLQGTSMSAPVVTGVAALLVEQWRRTFGGATPPPEVLRGLLIHGAKDLGTAGPDYTFGFGLVDAQASVDTIRDDNAAGARIRTDNATQGSAVEYSFTLPVAAAGRVTLVWSDPENTPYPTDALINDLDLEVVDGAGTVILPYVLNPGTPTTPAVRGVNVRDNVEQVRFDAPVGGVYKIRVKGARIATTAPQPFYIFTSHDLAGAKVACTDPFEPNNSQQQAYGRLPNNLPLRAAFCEPGDVDYYRFVVDRAGTATVTVKATDTPLRVAMTAGALSSTALIPANSTGTALLTFPGIGAITPTNVYVQVEMTTAPAANTSYTVTATYPSSTPNRTRPTRR